MEIIKAPNPILNKVCSEVVATSGETAVLAREMIHTMIAARGQGLAAPQVGVTARMICVRSGDTITVMCNPVITRRGREIVTDTEGCLSIPYVQVQVARHQIITVQWNDLDGSTKTAKLRGMDARCVQHEIDHLDGVLITKGA